MRAAPSLLLAALLAAPLAGCAEDTPYLAPDLRLLPPPPAGQGVQFGMTTTIDAGTEGERCLFVKAPPEGLFVQHDEARITDGIHHFLLFETDYPDIPTEKADGTPVDTSDVFDCSEGPAGSWSLTKVVSGSQNLSGDSLLRFPEHVAMPIRPGAVLLLNTHLINATDAPLDAEARINFYTIPESEVTQKGDSLFLYDAFIGIPAHSAARAQLRCPVYQDITLLNIQSHMHRRGVGYEASVAGEEPFYTNTQWNDVPMLDLGAGKKIKKGSQIEFHCDYMNNEDHDIFQGPRTSDEMCMAIGAFYPAHGSTSRCAIEGIDGTHDLGAEWVGQGDKTCKDTMICVQGALGKEDPLHGIMTCVMASSSDRSKIVSDALRCFILNRDNDPLATCKVPFDACLSN